MDFLIFGMASPPGGGGQGSLGSLLPMFIIIGLIMYFLVIKPEQRKKKDLKNMLNDMKKGDKVVTSSGIVGLVAGVKPDSIMLKVADNVKIEILRNHIAQIVGKNESKTT